MKLLELGFLQPRSATFVNTSSHLQSFANAGKQSNDSFELQKANDSKYQKRKLSVLAGIALVFTAMWLQIIVLKHKINELNKFIKP